MTDKNSPPTTEPRKASVSQRNAGDKKVPPSKVSPSGGAATGENISSQHQAKLTKKAPHQAGHNPEQAKSAAKKAAAAKAASSKVATKKETKTTTSKTTENKKSRNIVGWLALLLTISATGAGYIVWQNLFLHTTNLIVQSDSNRASLLTMQQRVETLDKALPVAVQKMTMNTGQQMLEMKQSLGRLGLAVSKLNSNDWLLSEVDYLLNIASHRLQLEGDIKTARTALTLADQRLKNFPHPGTLTVRKMIAQDLDALNKVTDPDIAGLVFSLMAIQNTIDSLPVRAPVVEKKDPVVKSDNAEQGVLAQSENDGIENGGWRVFMNDLWIALRDSLSSLVTIRRVESQQAELLPANELAFLLQNLDLKLEAARLALIKRETVLYKSNLNAVRKWLQRYFNSQSPAVMGVLKTLTDLEQVELNPALPDISVSLRALNKFKARLIVDKVAGKVSGKEAEKIEGQIKP